MPTSVKIELSHDEGLTITTRCEYGVWNFTFKTPSDFDIDAFDVMPEAQVLITHLAIADAMGNDSPEEE